MAEGKKPKRERRSFTDEYKAGAVRLLSGLLRCGVCGSSMSIVSTRTEGRVRYSNYGCSAHHGKGPAVCANGRLISERKVRDAVLRGIRGYVRSYAFEQWVSAATAAAERAKAKDDTEDRLVADIRTQQSKVQKIADTLLAVGVSDTLRAMLVKEEEKLRALRQQAAAAAAPKAPRIAIEPARVGAALSEVERLADRNPGTARDRLARYLAPVVLRPVMDQDEEVYEAEITLKNTTAALAGGRVIDEVSCGGRPWRTDHLLVAEGCSTSAVA